MPDGEILVGGDWLKPSDGKTLPVFNPSDGSEFAKIARGGARDIDAAVKAARAALDGPWGKLTAVERGRLMSKLAHTIVEHAEELEIGRASCRERV